MNLTFDKIKHEYRVDGNVVDSVTQVIDANGLSGLDGVDRALLARNADFGNAVHRMIELECKGTLDELTVSEELVPYLKAWRKFVSDFGYEFQEAEVRGYCEKYRYCYTIDNLGKITKGKYKGILALIDLKSGTAKPADEIQVDGGYFLAVEKKYKPGILYLNPEFKPSGYKIVFAKNSHAAQSVFLSALTLHNFRKSKGLL